MLKIYLTSVMVDTQIHIDSPIIDRNSPFYNDINDVEGGEAVAKSDAKSKCFNNHLELGKCILEEDDNPNKDGKCRNYCIVDCERGSVCKLMPGDHHECHCAC
ncbi:hypothetical protein Gogos_020177 [Gossypium gossypioides]|uniref:Defensin-like protein n=1 Tax=Gossypium gossypioides TaxID=34282 RepID=A0A7J9D778_GOSGO|nr:hypothetical protein [Gossypium gossypioides]